MGGKGVGQRCWAEVLSRGVRHMYDYKRSRTDMILLE
jgi:hypothetical protein